MNRSKTIQKIESRTNVQREVQRRRQKKTETEIGKKKKLEVQADRRTGGQTDI